VQGVGVTITCFIVTNDDNNCHNDNNSDEMMDKTDLALITELQRDARLPISKLAARLNMARTTVQARLDRLQSNGTITGYAVRLSDAATQNQIRATVLLNIDPRANAAVVSRLKSIPNVQTATSASGRFDMVLNVSAQTPSALDEILDEIGEIKGVHSSESLIQLSTKIDRAG
jgi:DNA-binding Lrp family transcriptional regulator